MASVWKRLQRVNKRAAKFQYTASYHQVDLETSPKWKPNKLSVVWTRRSRRVITEPMAWEPSLKDPLKGIVIYTIPENHTVAVTLFKDSRTNELEDKDWTFVLEDVSVTGKRRRLAVCSINMRKYASLEPSQRPLVVKLEPTTQKIVGATLHLTLHCVLLREGQATDEDMQSLASLLSVNNNSDIAVLEDLDEDDYTLSDNSTKQMSSLRQQMEELTKSLSSEALTPASVQSLALDHTPTAPPAPGSLTSPAQDITPTMENQFMNPFPSSLRIDLSNNITKPSRTESIFTSTPSKEQSPEPRLEFNSSFFKPKTIAKTNLKPLELKSNFNSISLDRNENEREKETDDITPTRVQEKLFPLKIERDKTPVQDLLEWVQSVTRDYSVKVRDLTHSFRSGHAFCAIIHAHRPELIDYSALEPDAAEACVRTALEASARLGIAQVLAPSDVTPSPDRLAIMTYLFQLRAHFTHSELSLGGAGEYRVGRHDTDAAVPAALFSREVATRRSRIRPNVQPQESKETKVVKETSPVRQSPSTDTLSPENKTPEPLPPRPEKLMTRKELIDPFASDEEEEQNAPTSNINGESAKEDLKLHIESPTDPLNVASLNKQLDDRAQLNATEKQNVKQNATPELPKPTPLLLSRHDELKERARHLLESAKREARAKEKKIQNSKEKDDGGKENINGFKNGDLCSGKKPKTEEERQAMLRERARKLIADARVGIVNPTSPTSPQRSRGTVEIISKQSVMEQLAAEFTPSGVEQLDARLRSDSDNSSPVSRKSSVSPARSDGSNEDKRSVKSIVVEGDTKRSPLHSFSALVERLSPDKDKDGDHIDEQSGSYLSRELEALEREQAAVDAQAAGLERSLRALMDSNEDAEEEDRLLSQWFTLVNKKNALLRRQDQLNILEKEEDLTKRCNLLLEELRLSQGVEEWRKTPAQKRNEQLLLQELLAAVNDRDRLVQEMDEQERAIADDDEIERNLSQVELQRKNNCILQ